MDKQSRILEIAGMAKKPRPKHRTLYIGPWLSKLERKPSEVAAKIGMNEGYLSQLISGEKVGPSGELLMSLSEELGITVNALYSRPPVEDIKNRVVELRPDLIDALQKLLDQSRGDDQ